MVDPITPNVDGLLENINQSYKVVIDQYGNIYYHLLLSGYLHASQGAQL
jgi:hypothetical protein